MKAMDTCSKSPQLTVTKLKTKWPRLKGYLAILENPIEAFHIYFPQLPDGSCGGVNKTSDQAKFHGCLFATDAAPGALSGNNSDTCRNDVFSYASDDKVYNLVDANHYLANFGITQSGYYVFGVLTKEQLASVEWKQLVTGFTILVLNGVVQNQTMIPPGITGSPPNLPPPLQRAPRVGIGADKDGRLMILEVDGVEDLKIGLTIPEFAIWLKELGAVQALNLDGGGSAAVFYNGSVIDHPNCDDTGRFCERNVTTITCIK
jgi:hypothetical protein